jgi:hypothetical protein
MNVANWKWSRGNSPLGLFPTPLTFLSIFTLGQQFLMVFAENTGHIAQHALS